MRNRSVANSQQGAGAIETVGQPVLHNPATPRSEPGTAGFKNSSNLRLNSGHGAGPTG